MSGGSAIAGYTSSNPDGQGASGPALGGSLVFARNRSSELVIAADEEARGTGAADGGSAWPTLDGATGLDGTSPGDPAARLRVAPPEARARAARGAAEPGASRRREVTEADRAPRPRRAIQAAVTTQRARNRRAARGRRRGPATAKNGARLQRRRLRAVSALHRGLVLRALRGTVACPYKVADMSSRVFLVKLARRSRSAGVVEVARQRELDLGPPPASSRSADETPLISGRATRGRLDDQFLSRSIIPRNRALSCCASRGAFLF